MRGATARANFQDCYAFLRLLPLLALGICACDRPKQADADRGAKTDTADQQPRIQTFQVTNQDLQRSIELPGTGEGFETADLYAKFGGYVDKILVDIGDRVTTGQEVAILQVPELRMELKQEAAAVLSAQSRVEQARAAVRQAEAEKARADAALQEAKSMWVKSAAELAFRRAEHERIAQLAASGSVNRQLLDETVLRRDAATADLDAKEARIQTAESGVAAGAANVDKAGTDLGHAEANVVLSPAKRDRVNTLLEYATIRAPFKGIITQRYVDQGAFVQSADGNSAAKPLLRVVRTDKVTIQLDVAMADIQWLNVGDSAILDRINVLPDGRFEGTVARLAGSLDRVCRTMRVEVDLENPDHRLLPGYYGYVRLVLHEFVKTPIVPSSALLADKDGRFVIIVKDGICERRLVALNHQDGTIVGIASGISKTWDWATSREVARPARDCVRLLSPCVRFGIGSRATSQWPTTDPPPAIGKLNRPTRNCGPPCGPWI